MKERFGFGRRDFDDDRDRFRDGYRGGDYDHGGRWESGGGYDDYDHYNSGHGGYRSAGNRPGWRGDEGVWGNIGGNVTGDYARNDYGRGGGYDMGRERHFGGPGGYDRGRGSWEDRGYSGGGFGGQNRGGVRHDFGGADYSRGDWNRGGYDRGYDRDRWSGARDERYDSDYYDRGPRYRAYEREFDPVEPAREERDPRMQWRGGRNRY